MLPHFDDVFRSEVALIATLLRHPAGFNVDLFALLGIRGTDQDVIEVYWDMPPAGLSLSLDDAYWRIKDGPRWRSYTSVYRAATLFCHMRRVLGLGIDLEIVEAEQVARVM